MKDKMTRRDFMQASLLGGAGAAIVMPGLGVAAQAANSENTICVTLANHWSYIGIGWQLGLESCVLSVIDAMEMADRPPGVKTLINQDARAYEFMAEKFPEVTERLKKYLKAGKVELIGGSFGQPMATMYSGESNIRQVVYGREAIKKALDYEMVTFLEEEEFSHPQLPQILVGAGFRYASLAQVDTFGRAGIPVLDVNVLNWQGKDGTTIPSTPKNALFGYSPDLKKLVSEPAFEKLRQMGKPLVFTWEEFGWEPHETPAYLTSPEKYRKFAEESPVEFVTLKEYMEKYGANPKETIYLKMDSWDKLLTWGLGGDQIRILDRKVEALLLAAERFDAIASTLGGESKQETLAKGWRDLLTSQSHDVGLCEYSRWYNRMAPLDRIEDYHNFAWGVIGYQHLDSAQKQGQTALDASLGHIAGRIGSAAGKHGEHVVTVFNPSGWERTALTATGRIYPLPPAARDIVVRDRAGRTVPSQIIKSDKDRSGNLVVAEVAFQAAKVPSVGYDTYYLEFAPEASAAFATDLKIDERALTLENEFLKMAFDSTNGAVTRLFDKRSGQEMLASSRGPFPTFRGRPNPDAYIQKRYVKKVPEIPASYDSSSSKAEITWIQKGPLVATLRAHHKWPFLEFETNVTLNAHQPYVEVISRVLADLPPLPDLLDEKGRFPSDIQEGYWLSFTPGFEPATLLRDFPLAIEPTENHAFHALSFVDLVGKGTGLLVLHAGTQWFSRDSKGTLSNLLIREWESRWTGEYGWPRYSEYRHALMPHRGDLTNAQRLRASAEFTQKMIPVLGPPRSGTLPRRKGFISVEPEGVQLSAFRKKSASKYELRVVETEGREVDSTVELAIPVAGAAETNLLGHKVADVSHSGSKLNFKIQPWKIRNFEVT
jgi:hypothetical protein